MASKQELISKMLKMQSMFTAYEQENGVQPVEYYMAEPGHPLHGYADKYRELAEEVLKLAHEERGSSA